MVVAADTLKKIRILFIDMVNMSTNQLTINYLSGAELFNRGDKSGFMTKLLYGIKILLTCMWMDPERLYFILSCSSLTDGKMCVR